MLYYVNVQKGSRLENLTNGEIDEVPTISTKAKRDVENPVAKQGRTSIHGLRPCMNCALRGPARTSESPGRVRRFAPDKGLRPLRR